jgi:hypothetical protein
MTMPPRLRKFALTAHVASSVGLLGAVAGFLVLSVAGLTSHDAWVARAAYVAMNLTAEFVIVPLAFASLLVGIVESLGTMWGLWRYYWVVAKLLLTVFATIVLLLQMDTIGRLADLAADGALSTADLGQQTRLVVHAAGGLLVLLVPVVLSVYKPWGITRYAVRKRSEQPTAFAP